MVLPLMHLNVNVFTQADFAMMLNVDLNSQITNAKSDSLIVVLVLGAEHC